MTSDFDPVSPEVNHSSPGKLLRDAREQLGLTQEQVAKELFMTLTKVKAIEADQYTRLHSDTFIRGYLRAYAQLVKLDVVSLMSIYDSQAKILGIKEVFVPVKKHDSPNRKIWQFALLLVVLLLLVWLVSVWFLDNRTKNDYSNIKISAPEKILTVAASSRATSEQSATASHSASSTSLIVQGSDRLDFYFRDECWVEVSDANGDVLVTELQLKESQLTLTGQRPFEIKLGNAPAVSLKLNDEDVNLVPALGTNVLTIKVGDSLSQ